MAEHSTALAAAEVTKFICCQCHGDGESERRYDAGGCRRDTVLQSFDTFHQMQEVLVFSTSQKDYAVYETLSSMSYVCQQLLIPVGLTAEHISHWLDRVATNALSGAVLSVHCQSAQEAQLSPLKYM